MKILLALALAFAVYYFFFRKKKPKATPQPQEAAMTVTPTAIPIRPVPAAPQLMPQAPIRAKNGVWYTPDKDNFRREDAYFHGDNGTVINWLVLYSLLSDSNKAEYITPSGYTTDDDARMLDIFGGEPEKTPGDSILDILNINGFTPEPEPAPKAESDIFARMAEDAVTSVPDFTPEPKVEESTFAPEPKMPEPVADTPSDDRAFNFDVDTSSSNFDTSSSYDSSSSSDF